jgi:hypothetical protein
MKRALAVLLICLMSLIFMPAFAGEQTPKVYSLQEFLDSLYAYQESFVYRENSELKEDVTIKIGWPAELEKDLIEISLRPFFYEYEKVMSPDSEGNWISRWVLYKNAHRVIKNKERTEQYSIYNFRIETKPYKESANLDELQKKFFEAMLEQRPIKIRGRIAQGGYHAISVNKCFFNFYIYLEIVEIKDIVNQ